MNWDDIRIMVEVCRRNSFTAAAESLGLSKATVSRRIATLEAMSGARLFDRTPGGATLTASGEVVLSRALRIEAELADLERMMRSIGKDKNRTISVRMSEGVASYLVTPLIAGQPLGPLGISAKKNSIDIPFIRIVPMDGQSFSDVDIVWTSQGKFPNVGGNSVVRKLADISFVPFASVDYAAVGRGVPEHFDELAKHKLVTLDAYRGFLGGGWESWHGLLSSERVDSVSVAWSCSVGHLTLRGAGVGVLPTYSPLYADGLEMVGIKSPNMSASLWMTFNKDAACDKFIKRSIETLWSLFSKADWMNG